MLNTKLFGMLSLGLITCALSSPSALADHDWDRNHNNNSGYSQRSHNNNGRNWNSTVNNNWNNGHNDNNWNRGRHDNNWNRGQHDWNKNNTNWRNGSNLNSQVDLQQGRINTRISSGLSSGRLTQAEANMLMQRQARIDAAQAQYNADGRLSMSERARLSSQSARLQAQLWKEMNDRNARNRWY